MSDPTLETIHTLLVGMDGRMENIERALFTGNGQPPVLSRLSTLEERTSSVEGRTRGAPFWTGIGSGVGAAIVVVLGYFGIKPPGQQ